MPDVTVLAYVAIAATVASTIVSATAKPPKAAKPPPTERPAEAGREGALAAARESDRRRRRLALGRRGTITGAGSGLLKSGSEGGSSANAQPQTPGAYS